MGKNDYELPVSRLLEFGDALSELEWRDYGEWGIGPEHEADLIRMMGDVELNLADEDGDEVWAPAHAWRALGQLRSEAAVGPMIGHMEWCVLHDDDWGQEEIPLALGMIGAPAIPALKSALADPDKAHYFRVAIIVALQKIAENHPELEEECIAELVKRLETETDAELNGFILCAFLDLGATETLPAIEKAFEEDRVNPDIAGDLRAVYRYWGVAVDGLDEQEDPRERFEGSPFPGWAGNSNQTPGGAQKKKKSKQQKKSRRKNRKR